MITTILFYAFICTGLSLFYEYATRDGMILHKWYTLIEKMQGSNRFGWLFDILGGCIYCNNPYLTALFLFGFGETRAILSVLSFISIIAINHIFLRVWNHYVND